MTIQITLDDNQVNAALTRLSNNLSNTQPAMAAIGEQLVSLIKGQLRRGQTPWGDEFQPLSEAYLEAVPRRVGGIPLNDTHEHIMNRITRRAGNGFVDVGILDHPETPGLAIAHQLGLGVPARPYLPISNNRADLPPAWLDDVLHIITLHLTP